MTLNLVGSPMPQPLPKAISASTENAFGTSGRRLAFNAEDKFCRHINQLADMASLVRWQSHMAGNDTENEPMSSMNAFMQAVGADSLLLDGAEDKAASLCRAWIIQNCWVIPTGTLPGWSQQTPVTVSPDI